MILLRYSDGACPFIYYCCDILTGIAAADKWRKESNRMATMDNGPSHVKVIRTRIRRKKEDGQVGYNSDGLINI